MNDTIAVALIVSVIAPIITGLITSWVHRSEKKQDWQRQDAVAKQAREAAALLLINNNRVAAAAEAATEKLDVIHTLVNSNLTTSLRSELNATKLTLQTLKEIMELRKVQGTEPSEEVLRIIQETQTKVNSLQRSLSDRESTEEEIKKK